MDPYSNQTPGRAGSYVPARAKATTKKHARRSFPAWFRTAGRARYLVAVVIIGVCALSVPVLVRTAAGPQPAVLTAAHDLPAGHILTVDDLKTATGSGPAGSAISADHAASLIGQQLKDEVPSGAVLAPGDLGPYPPTGTTLVPVAVKPGQYPPNLQSGCQVAIFPIGDATTATTQAAAHAAATGRVVQIQAQPDSANGTVVVLLVTSTAQAPVIAQAQGVVLVTLDAAGDLP